MDAALLWDGETGVSLDATRAAARSASIPTEAIKELRAARA